MKILYDLETPLQSEKPIALTIGNFDGFHLGHQFVIDKLLQEAKKQNNQTAVITFDSHPSQVLRPEKSILQIMTLNQKIALLKQTGIDYLFLLKFTKEFSQQTPEAFLQKLQSIIPFDTLILGHDAAIGKDREGNHKRVAEYAKNHFTLITLEPHHVAQTTISSSLIRQLIQKGALSEVAQFLGRPYSIQGIVIRGQGKGKVLGFPTANLEVEGLCLPPLGVYAVQVKHQDKLYKAIANLGVAPTIRQEAHPLLEIHLLNTALNLYGQTIEVIFQSFIRPEKRFDSPQQLAAQIQQDLQAALDIFTN